MSARDETTCHLCGNYFPLQQGYRLFWTGNDGHAYCTPLHAIEGGGDPDRIMVRRDSIEHFVRRMQQ